MNALKRNIIISLAALIALTSGATTAEEAQVSNRLSESVHVESIPSQPVSERTPLYALIVAAYENNPGIAAARAEWRAALEGIPQAESLPDPMIGVSYTPLPMEKAMGSNRYMFMASQMFPAIGKRGLLGDRASLEAESARIKLDITVRDAITELKKSYAELQYLEEAISLSSRQREFVSRMADISRRDYGAGKAEFLDLAAAESQLAQIDYDLTVLRELRGRETARANAILSRPPDSPVIVSPPEDPTPPDLTLEDLYSLLSSSRQETLLDYISMDIGRVDVSLAKKANVPDLNLGIVYDTPGKFKDPEMRATVRNTWTYTVEMNLPIYRRKNNASKSEAEQRVEAARLRLDNRLNNARAELADAYFRMTTSLRLTALYRDTLVPQADKAVETAETLYNSGEESFSTLLETQSAWLNFNLALARARADVLRYSADIERITGAAINATGGVK